MRNPEFFRKVRDMLGIEPRVVQVPSWRQVRLLIGALDRIKASGRIEPEFTSFVERILPKKEGRALYEAAGKDRAHVEAAVREFVQLGKGELPIGTVTSKESLASLLVLYVEAIAELKRTEDVRLQSEANALGDKRDIFKRMQTEKASQVNIAVDAARRMSVSVGALDRLYDDAHGPYSSINGTVGMRVPHLAMSEIIQSLTDYYVAEGFVQMTPAEYKAIEVSTSHLHAFETQASREGGWIFLDSHLTTLAPNLSKRFGTPVLYCGQGAAFEKEIWKAEVFVDGLLADRHCSNPIALDEVRELEETAEAEVTQLVESWCGDSGFWARTFSADETRIRPYLLQFDHEELARLWGDKPLFVSLKANAGDRFSLASPWSFLDLLSVLTSTRVGFSWEMPGDSLYFKRPVREEV